MKRLNRTLLVGMALGLCIVFGAILGEVDGGNPRVFLHPVALLIVFGGSCAGALVSLPSRELWRVLKRTYWVIRFPKDDFVATLREIVRVSVGMSKDVLFLEKLDTQVGNAMFRDGLGLVGMGFKAEDVRKLLEIKKEQNENALAQCSVLYFNMAKMGPAFGLLGTLVGLIILLYYHMQEGHMDKVASSMGVALTATLYGVGIANLIFQPLAEYLQYNAERGAALDAMVIEGTVQIRERRHPVYLVQALKAYMPREDYPEIDRVVREEMAAAAPKAEAAARKEAA